MAAWEQEGGTAPPRWLIVALIPVVLAVGGWLMLHTNTSYGARGCRTLYRAAKTAADSAVIDTTVVLKNGKKGPNDRSCLFIRSR